MAISLSSLATALHCPAATARPWKITCCPNIISPFRSARRVSHRHAGTYGFTQQVSISSLTNGATIRYTTDGSTPSETAGTVYSGPVAISRQYHAAGHRLSEPDSPIARLPPACSMPIQCAAPAVHSGGAAATRLPVRVTITTTSRRDHPLYHRRQHPERDQRHGLQQCGDHQRQYHAAGHRL